jgi:hypothetical protein
MEGGNVGTTRNRGEGSLGIDEESIPQEKEGCCDDGGSLS